jgi:hypothetical protein
MVIDVPVGIIATQLILYNLLVLLNGIEGESLVPIVTNSFAKPTPIKAFKREVEFPPSS